MHACTPYRPKAGEGGSKEEKENRRDNEEEEEERRGMEEGVGWEMAGECETDLYLLFTSFIITNFDSQPPILPPEWHPRRAPVELFFLLADLSSPFFFRRSLLLFSPSLFRFFVPTLLIAGFVFVSFVWRACMRVGQIKTL